MQRIKKLNCKACGGTHFGLLSKDGLVVECPTKKVIVEVKTGKVIESAPVQPKQAEKEKPAPKKRRARKAKKG